MFGLFSDYKSEEQIELEFAVKKLKAYHILHSSLINNWEDSIMKNMKFLLYDSDIRDLEEMKGLYEKPFERRDFSRLLSQAEDNGPEEMIEAQEEKLNRVEMMMGNRLIKKNIAEKEINLSDSTFELVSNTEQKVGLLRKQLQDYPKKVGEYNKKIGRGLLLRRRMLDVIDILDVIKYTKLLGGNTKRDMMKLLREQNWHDLEPNRFLNIKSVKDAITSLRKRISHFEKEIKDELCQLLQKPSYEVFLNLVDFLFTVDQKKEEWAANSKKYQTSFKAEMDQLMALLTNSDHYIDSTVSRLIDLWVSPLRFSLGDFQEDDFASPKKAPRNASVMLSIEPTIIITCIINLLNSLENCMSSWNKLIKYSFILQNNLKNKLTQEEKTIQFLEVFRRHLFQHKSTLLKRAFTSIEKYVELVRAEQISRINPKNILKLRIHLSNMYKSAQLFSSVVPENKIESEYETLVECYLDQTMNTHIDLLLTIIRTSDSELSTFDYSTFSKQIQEVIVLSKEFDQENWYVFGNGDRHLDKFKRDIDAMIKSHPNCKDRDSLDHLVSGLQQKVSSLKPVQFSDLNKEISQKLASLLNREDLQSGIRVDTSGAMVVSFSLVYAKFQFYLPEFQTQISKRLEFLYDLYYYLTMNRVLSPVTMQFILSGGFNLLELNSEDALPQLENYHDIVLFQKKYNELRSSFKRLNDFISASTLPGLKEKMVTNLAELMAASVSKTDTKDKLMINLQKVLRIICSMYSLHSLSIFADHRAKIEEMSELVIYSTILNQTKEAQVFSKCGKVKWEDLKEAEQVGEYVSEVVSSIKTALSSALKLGRIS